MRGLEEGLEVGGGFVEEDWGEPAWFYWRDWLVVGLLLLWVVVVLGAVGLAAVEF